MAARLDGRCSGCKAFVLIMFFVVRHWILFLVFALAVLLPEASARSQARAEQSVGATGLPLPRFVSLRASEINLRIGPGTRFPIDWVYRRPGLPVEIINEHDNWRQIRDHENTVGWVHMSMLSSQRGALIMGETRVLHRDPDPASSPVAHLEPGVIGQLDRCERGWCRIEVSGHAGWLARESVFGLYADEILR